MWLPNDYGLAMAVLNALKQTPDFLRYLGPKWLFFRGRHALAIRSGYLKKRLPVVAWEEVKMEECFTDKQLARPERYLQFRRNRAPKFFFAQEYFSTWKPHFSAFDRNLTSPVMQADQILTGTFRAFLHSDLSVGYPPDWHANILSGERTPIGRHFTEIRDFDYGDIKAVWELSRFSFAFTLARAYARSSCSVYGRTFWFLFLDWCRHNPPNTGANWKCGQEVALRSMAWIFAFYAFLADESTTDENAVSLAKAIFKSGLRIYRNIDYGLSQNNNHGISEAVGLFSIGVLFPEFQTAAKWKAVGRAHLERLSRSLFYDDGAFAQSSLNYERVALHGLLWAFRLAEIHGEPFSDEARTRVCRAGAFLYSMQEQTNGRVPNYGHNDGALVLPITNCDYTDFRPVVQTAMYLERGESTFGPGAWEEEVLWLCGSSALSADTVKPPLPKLLKHSSGYLVCRSLQSFSVLRVPNYFHRPGQADALHFDLWFDGRNIAGDPGTYSYNTAGPWDNQLERTLYHNTIVIGGRDQMRKVSRFLWLPWLEAQIHRAYACNDYTLIEAEHFGYAPASHRRAVLEISGVWIVIDVVELPAPTEVRIQWLFPVNDLTRRDDTAIELRSGDLNLFFAMATSSVDMSVSIVRADPNSPRGWISRYYLSREPAYSFAASGIAGRYTVYCSVFSRSSVAVEIFDNLLSVRTTLMTVVIKLKREGSRVVDSVEIGKP